MYLVQLALLLSAQKLILAVPTEWKPDPLFPYGTSFSDMSDKSRKDVEKFKMKDPINVGQHLKNEMRYLRDDMCPDCIKLCMYPYAHAEISPRSAIGIAIRRGLVVSLQRPP